MGVMPRRALAVTVGHAARWSLRRLGRGGTTLPGLLAQAIDPDLLRALGSAIPNGSVLVTGTNGKTTTTRLLVGALRLAGMMPITNREGSNLLRGLATTLLMDASAVGNLRVPSNAIGVFEVDEATLLPAVTTFKPRLVVITNLFRDQLDRYFEVDFVAHLWAEALRLLPESTTLVLNADDPQVAYLGDGRRNAPVYFGLEDRTHGRSSLEHTADSRRCLRCSADLVYTCAFYAHLGHYACGECGWQRPTPDVAATTIRLLGLESCSVEAATPWGVQKFSVRLAGLPNAYNALAAATVAMSLGAAPEAVSAALTQARAAFGRMEQFSFDGRQVCLALVKNPSGFNEMLRLVLDGGKPKRMMLALNDQVADSRDVSWIWDVDLEQCLGRVKIVVIAGTRAYDMAVRLKYAGVLDAAVNGAASGLGRPESAIEPDVVAAFRAGLARTEPGETLYVLATYTAAWTLREHLVHAGQLDPFWRE